MRETEHEQAMAELARREADLALAERELANERQMWVEQRDQTLASLEQRANSTNVKRNGRG